VIRVATGWDEVEGFVEPKSAQGRRTVPVAAVLRGFLLELNLRQGRPTEGLVFGRSATRPFCATTITKRTFKAWEDVGLERITLHEARHTFASYAIAGGRERQGALGLYGPREHQHHARPLWPPDAR
jgi:integrase